MAIGNQRSLRARGFSFTEVMFAVILLGIGFIMVAAIFPVAIRQTKSTSEETNAAIIARAAVNYLENLPPTDALMPVTGTAAQPDRPKVLPMTGTLFNAMRGNVILPSDNRYAWVALYRRAGDPAISSTWSPYAQVFVIAVQVRNKSTYSATDLTTTELQAQLVNLVLSEGDAGSDTVQFYRPGTPANVDSVSEGTYVLIADDKETGTNAGLANGRIYRIGNQATGSDTWELQPGGDMAIGPGTTNENLPVRATGAAAGAPTVSSAAAYIIGRGANPDPSTTDRVGTARDISIYTTFVPIK